MGVTFLATHSRRGNVPATGPVTGIEYMITPQGSPVNDLDVPGLLKVTGPPCCGQSLPFGGQVKLFGKTAGSSQQYAKVPESILNAGPLKKEKKKEPEVVKKEDKVEVNDTPLMIGVAENETVKENQED